MTTPVIGIVGYKNAGKTTLVTGLVAELVARGYRVSTVKHAHHAADVDQPGSDSHSHRQAGAGEVALVTPLRYAIMGELRGQPEPGLEQIVARLAPADLVIVEGFKREPIPKIEVRRAGAEHDPLAGEGSNVVAIASDAALDDAALHDAALPVLALGDVGAIADFIIDHLRLEHRDVRAVG